jgi:polyribonucleotide nucleotidyltransferase
MANERVEKVTDIVNEGDQVKVKVIAIDDRGRVKLSMRAVDQETGEELEVEPRPQRSGGGPRQGGPRRPRRQEA